ncbi:kinase-like protein [Exidia glandulosa HHB12029]|uniref:Kinase-like protein n=1 Tax=Exidia glandulosa HHB12029 TaxID=1314781 RepID=A0A165IFS6_EXIGL|nr:kinase-like protein [Exidia glandulosa HHB12029]
MRLEPRKWWFRLVPAWGEVRICRTIQSASAGASTLHAGNLHWFRKQEEVVLEELPAAAKGRKDFARNLQTLRSTRHPNVQSTYGVCRSTDSLFIVRLHVEAVGVVQFLRTAPLTDRRRLVLQVVDGLRYLHDLGIVHGDLHGDNVQVDPSGTPVLVGFGSLQLCRDEGRSSARDVDWVHAQKDSDYDIPDDTAVSDVIKTRADNALLSFDENGDLFSLGFLIVEIFSEATPRTSVRTFEMLRRALKRQRPLYPGGVAMLRGLDRRHWDACLSCWGVGLDDPWTLQDMVKKLSETNDNIVQVPFGRDLNDDDLQLPHIDDQVRDIRKVKEGRDAELDMHEVRGIWDQEGGQAVDIKIITPDHCRRCTLGRPNDFLAEAYMWSQLRHANILPLIATVRYNQAICFVVPWMAGGTCVDFLRTNPDADRLKLLLNIGDALHYLHTREPTIVHGYVRARSVLVSQDGVAYLGNFDFLPLQEPERNIDTFDESYIDKAGRWNAPELSVAEYTTKSDVFGFAMFAYEVYSGRKPYYNLPEYPGGRNQPGVWEVKVAGGRPERPSSDALSDKLWNLIQRCWDHAPRLRPSMGTVVRELREIQTERRAQQETS